MEAKPKKAAATTKTGSSKPSVAKGAGKKKKVKKANVDGGDAPPKGTKKSTQKSTKKEEMKIMTLDDIEELFEKKSQVFHNKMLEYQ